MWIILLDKSGSMSEAFKGALDFSGRTRLTDEKIKIDAAKQALIEHLSGIGNTEGNPFFQKMGKV